MKRLIAIIISALLLVCFVGCGDSTNTNGVPDPDKIVPKREILIENLEDKGYQIKTQTTVEGSDLVVDRVIAQKESKFIDKYMDYLLKILRKFLNCTVNYIPTTITFLLKTETMFIVLAIKRLSKMQDLQQRTMLVFSI